MASTNWTALTEELDVAALDRGVTTGIARPSGGGSFVFGFNSLVTDEGAAGYYANQANFSPTAANKGGRITGAVARGISGDSVGFAPLLYILGQGTSLEDDAYILGLQDDSPNRIALRKGSLITGVPNAIPTVSGILRRSTTTFAPGAWVHLRLDAIVNLNGDVILKVFQNDLDAHNVTSPSWEPVAGIEDEDLIDSHGVGTAFVDDALAVNSGTAPFTSGRMGFAFYTNGLSRRGYFDQIECIRQT